MSSKNYYKKSGKSSKALNKNQKNLVKKLINRSYNQKSEWKFHLTTVSGAADNAGGINTLSDITQNNTDTSRNGDEVRLSTISIRYHWENGDSYNIARLIIFQWFSSSAAAPTVADLLTVDATEPVLSSYNTDRAHQYKIMYDKCTLISENYSGHTNSSKVVYKKLRAPRKQLKFRETTTVGTNKIFYLVISDSSIGSHPLLQMITRLNYTDN